MKQEKFPRYGNVYFFERFPQAHGKDLRNTRGVFKPALTLYILLLTAISRFMLQYTTKKDVCQPQNKETYVRVCF